MRMKSRQGKTRGNDPSTFRDMAGGKGVTETGRNGYNSRAMIRLFARWDAAAALAADRGLASIRRKTLPIALTALVLGLALLGASVSAPKHGLRGHFYPSPDFAGIPASVAIDPVIHFTGDALAVRAGDSGTPAAVWEGFLFAPKTSTYRFAIVSDGDARVEIGGRSVLEAGGATGDRRVERDIDLEQGAHAVVIRSTGLAGDGEIDFRWRETLTPKALMPRLPLYPRPITMAAFVLDTALSFLRPLLRALFLAVGLVLLLSFAGGGIRKRDPVQVLAVVLFLVLGGLYEARIFAGRSTAVSGCDTYSYLQGAERMAEAGPLTTGWTDPLVPEIVRRFPERPSPERIIFLLSPHGHYVWNADEGSIYTLFPPGMSLLLLPWIGIGGREAAFLFLPVLNLAVLILLFVLGSRVVHPVFGLMLAAATMFNVHVAENTVALMGDLPSTALLAAGAGALFQNLRKPDRRLPILAGAAFGIALLVRYSNAAGLVPLAFLLFSGVRRKDRRKASFRDALIFGGTAAATGLLPLALYTHRLFGTVFRLVYEPLSRSRMSLSELVPGMRYYLESAWRTFGPLTLALAVLGAASLLARPGRRPVAVPCLAAVGSFFAFYALNSIQNERYLMPAFPFLGVLAAFGLMEIIRRLDRSFIARVLVVAVFAAAPLFRSIGTYRGGDVFSEDLARALGRMVEPGAVIFGNDLTGPVRLYAGLTGYRFLDTDDATLVRTAAIIASLGRPVYVYLDDPPSRERFKALIERRPDFGERLGYRGRLRGRELYRYRPDAPFDPPRASW